MRALNGMSAVNENSKRRLSVTGEFNKNESDSNE
jgi:hypothetical protein